MFNNGVFLLVLAMLASCGSKSSSETGQDSPATQPDSDADTDSDSDADPNTDTVGQFWTDTHAGTTDTSWAKDTADTADTSWGETADTATCGVDPALCGGCDPGWHCRPCTLIDTGPVPADGDYTFSPYVCAPSCNGICF